MKRKYLLGIPIAIICVVAIILCIVLPGRNGGTEEGDSNETVGGWTLNSDIEPLTIPEKAEAAFERATKEYVGMSFKPIALLGSQVVSGMNYMFICEGTTVTQNPEASLKMVVVYNDLNDNSSITSVKDFDYTKYTNVDIKGESKTLAGGWQVDSFGEEGVLDEKVQASFDKATADLTDISYKPIAVLGTQVVAGTNYAVLCYGSSNDEDALESVYVVTLYENLNGGSEISSQAYVDLAEYNS